MSNSPTHPGPIFNSEQIYANSVDTPDSPLSSDLTTQAAGPWLPYGLVFSRQWCHLLLQGWTWDEVCKSPQKWQEAIWPSGEGTAGFQLGTALWLQGFLIP